MRAQMDQACEPRSTVCAGSNARRDADPATQSRLIAHPVSLQLAMGPMLMAGCDNAITVLAGVPGLEPRPTEPEGNVALSRRASSPRLKAAKRASQSPWKTMTNRAFEPCRGASGRVDKASSSGPIAQCNSALAPASGSASAPGGSRATRTQWRNYGSCRGCVRGEGGTDCAEPSPQSQGRCAS